MSAQAITLRVAVSAAGEQEEERRSVPPCLGLAVGVGLLSWLALGSLLGIVLA